MADLAVKKQWYQPLLSPAAQLAGDVRASQNWIHPH